MFLRINFCVDNLTTSANAGNFVNCMFEHSKIFSKQIHPNLQIFCDATWKNKDVKSKTTNMMSTQTNVVASVSNAHFITTVSKCFTHLFLLLEFFIFQMEVNTIMCAQVMED